MTNVDRVLAEAMKLTDEQRTELIDRLAKTEAPMNLDIQKAWHEEAKRRLADYRAGKTNAIPWEEARARLFSVD